MSQINIAITDANIFIDLFELELLSLLFDLDLAIHTTQEVFLECDKEQQKQLATFVKKQQLFVHLLTEEQVKELKTLSFSRRLSFSDQTILWLAYKEKNMVLTGDNLIRKWCVKNELEVHGILWVLEQFTTKDLLTPTKAIAKLKFLMNINLWLPTAFCEALIKKWEEMEKDN